MQVKPDIEPMTKKEVLNKLQGHWIPDYWATRPKEERVAHAKKMAGASVKKRFGGKTKEEISEIMRKVKKGVSTKI